MKRIKTYLACILAAAAAVLVFACADKAEEKKYTVTFDTRGGTFDRAPYTVSISAGSSVNRPSEDPKQEMFVFDAWYFDADYTTPFVFGSKMPSNDITLYAKWTPVVSVRIDYDANGGSFADDKEVYQIGTVGAAYSDPEDVPTRVGYVFGGWCTDREGYEDFAGFEFPIENATLYARWDKSSAYAYISYYGNGALMYVDPVLKGETVAAADLFDDADNIVCEKWYTDRDMTVEYTFGGAATGDVSLYAAFYTDGLTINNGVVTDYDGSSTRIVVPNVYGGKTVTRIGEYAFYDAYSAVTEVVLPDSVSVIEAGAFYECRYLVDINLSQNVAEIGANAFYKNTRLKNIGYITGVTTIGAGAFLGCESLSAIELPQGLTSLGSEAFSDCKMLKKASLPLGIYELPARLFEGCTLLEEVSLSSPLLVSVGSGAFKNCTSLKKVTISRDTIAVVIEADAFANTPQATVYVPQSLLDEYKNASGNSAIKDKFEAIG